MMLVKTYVAPSSIQGIGVHAGEFIPAGTQIWDMHPLLDVLIPKSEIATLPPHMQAFVETYSFPHLEMDDTLVLESDNGRFMNHSETPNTDFTIFSRGVALRDIEEGEELTCNYYEFDPTFQGLFPAAQNKTMRRRGRNGNGNGRRHQPNGAVIRT